MTHLHLDSLSQNTDVFSDAAVEDEGDFFLVGAEFPRKEADGYVQHGTGGQNICSKVQLQVRGVPELALKTEHIEHLNKIKPSLTELPRFGHHRRTSLLT